MTNLIQAPSPENAVVNIGCKVFGGVTIQGWPGNVYQTQYLKGPSSFDPTYQAYGITVVSQFFWQEWLILNFNDGMILAGNIFAAPAFYGAYTPPTPAS